ncbi:unnamed protein product [Somion occarium]|uniref:Protein kinase domain-containing protein n=1 Tax=Somion occarium TaxID=3059160 RepID=A0ABP1D9B4_9APHY
MSPVLRRSSSSDSDSESQLSDCSSSSSCGDEDEFNKRIAPNWCAHRLIIERCGFRLDTRRDVKLWYQHYWESLISQGYTVTKDLPGYTRACNGSDDNELCKDAGLPENLFRGTRCKDGTKVVIKAVHLRSREYDVVRYLSSPSLRNDPRNHLIPILDLIEVPKDDLVFMVMEEWSSHLIPETPCTLRLYLGALRQCIEHAVFMHSHHIAHLDISIRNMLTDYRSNYAYIDFELARRFDGIHHPRIRGCRGTEVPPELEQGGVGDPYKTDVWALGRMILRACSLTGYHVPELAALVGAMLNPNFEQRPTAAVALKSFDTIMSCIPEARLRMSSGCNH